MTEQMRQAISAINDQLCRETQRISSKIWSLASRLKQRVMDKADWVTDTELSPYLVFTWQKAKAKNHNDIACVVHEFYHDLAELDRSLQYPYWHSDHLVDCYPVLGRHALWFHALYDHGYGQNALTWQDIARLQGCYLDYSQQLQSIVTLISVTHSVNLCEENQYVHEFRSLESYQTYLALKQALEKVEQVCKQELMQSDYQLTAELQDEDHPLFDYELSLTVSLMVSEDSPYFHHDGDVATYYLSAKGISHQPTLEMSALGDGGNHNDVVKTRLNQEQHEFLLARLLDRCVLRYRDFDQITEIWAEITVRRKEWMIHNLTETNEVIQQQAKALSYPFMVDIPQVYYPKIQALFVDIYDYCQVNQLTMPDITKINITDGVLQINWQERSTMTHEQRERIDEMIRDFIMEVK